MRVLAAWIMAYSAEGIQGWSWWDIGTSVPVAELKPLIPEWNGWIKCWCELARYVKVQVEIDVGRYYRPSLLCWLGGVVFSP